MSIANINTLQDKLCDLKNVNIQPIRKYLYTTNRYILDLALKKNIHMIKAYNQGQQLSVMIKQLQLGRIFMKIENK